MTSESNIFRTETSTGRTVRSTYKAARADASRLQGVVCDFEDALKVQVRWTPGMKEYDDAKAYLTERKYRLALDHVERLVVQRLFELQKTHLASTGEFSFEREDIGSD